MTRNSWILLIGIVGGVIFLSGLGTWQLNRLAWKEALISRVQAGLKSAPLSLGEIEQKVKTGQDIEYRPTHFEGRFEHASEAHFFITHKGRPGYFVYTPLRLADGRFLWVNRGFVAIENKDAARRAAGQVEGHVSLTGLARTAPAQKPNYFVPENDLTKNVFYWKSLAQMIARTKEAADRKYLPFFVDVDDKVANPGNMPLGGVTRITFPNSHLQYALTWFGLAGALLVVGGMFLRGRVRDA